MRKENCLAEILVGEFRRETLTFAACEKQLILTNMSCFGFCFVFFFFRGGSFQSNSNNVWVINLKDQNSVLFDTNVG